MYWQCTILVVGRDKNQDSSRTRKEIPKVCFVLSFFSILKRRNIKHKKFNLAEEFHLEIMLERLSMAFWTLKLYLSNIL